MATQPMFKFELGWLLRERFMDKVRDIWRHVVGCCTPMEIWQRKIRRLRQYLRDWAKNTIGKYKKDKKEILNTLDMLDKKIEHIPLDANEINIKQCLNNQSTHLL
jgi:hypothetical protein